MSFRRAFFLCYEPMMPVFLLTIFYWTIYSQMASMFVIQARFLPVF